MIWKHILDTETVFAAVCVNSIAPAMMRRYPLHVYVFICSHIRSIICRPKDISGLWKLRCSHNTTLSSKLSVYSVVTGLAAKHSAVEEHIVYDLKHETHQMNSNQLWDMVNKILKKEKLRSIVNATKPLVCVLCFISHWEGREASDTIATTAVDGVWRLGYVLASAGRSDLGFPSARYIPVLGLYCHILEHSTQLPHRPDCWRPL